ncbi:sensor histidine kinase [Rhodanobacter denitrificans]|uniref:histidine kinase n=1 Tax=Rhodanobacter denitrificans TaxID=666685 RepID=M4NJP7_9GAMM|nr:ATP-binding protein [Rhodanobacter denitrificans]AGG87986.1 HAMP domain-containing protein,histidine kinase [Rhodanobacter denitrificans]UJM87139.1 ATP-binding protein [Rhodanobacter denitrificans]
MWRRLNSLQGCLTLLLAVAGLAGALVYAGVTQWPLPQLLLWLRKDLALSIRAPMQVGIYGGLLASVVVLLPLAFWLAGQVMAPVSRLLRALEGAVASYRDGDFSFSIAINRRDELGELIRMHNALGQTLREQRQHLVQRELLLDTVVQNTPVALVLTDAIGKVAYANIASRHLFNEGRSLVGLDFAELLAEAPEALRKAVESGEDALLSVEMDGSEETFHLSQRAFRLQGRPHRLHLFRRMTRELSRQEVATWKRVIRVISHELNNSLAPITSLAHSGAELARRGQLDRLPGVFATIGERALHLHRFIAGYASFAKLPTPQPADIAWKPFLDGLALHCQYRLASPAPERPGHFDAVQIEQVLINLIKNAHESGGPADEVTLSIMDVGNELRIEVADRGPGMSETVLAQALLPFYSTKRSGTGLGLALAREITEAHGGRVLLANREGGGLRVSLRLPQPAAR